MGANLIVSAVVVVFLAGGGAFLWKSIGDKRVAAYQAEVKVEQDKLDATTATQLAVEAKHVDELVDAWQVGMEEGRRNAPRGAAVVRAARATAEAFNNPICTAPAQTYALYQAALSTLHKGEIPEALLVPAVAPPAPIVAPKPPATAPAPTPTRRPVVNPLTGKKAP